MRVAKAVNNPIQSQVCHELSEGDNFEQLALSPARIRFAQTRAAAKDPKFITVAKLDKIASVSRQTGVF